MGESGEGAKERYAAATCCRAAGGVSVCVCRPTVPPGELGGRGGGECCWWLIQWYGDDPGTAARLAPKSCCCCCSVCDPRRRVTDIGVKPSSSSSRLPLPVTRNSRPALPLPKNVRAWDAEKAPSAAPATRDPPCPLDRRARAPAADVGVTCCAPPLRPVLCARDRLRKCSSGTALPMEDDVDMTRGRSRSPSLADEPTLPPPTPPLLPPVLSRPVSPASVPAERVSA